MADGASGGPRLFLSATELDGSRISRTGAAPSTCERKVSASTVWRMTDWRGWHDDYEDPASDLSHRLRSVERLIRNCADEHPPVSITSLAASRR